MRTQQDRAALIRDLPCSLFVRSLASKEEAQPYDPDAGRSGPAGTTASGRGGAAEGAQQQAAWLAAWQPDSAVEEHELEAWAAELGAAATPQGGAAALQLQAFLDSECGGWANSFG